MTDPQHITDQLSLLLGRDGADLGCERCFDELDRYVELGLAGRDGEQAVPGMRAHLDGCPACAEEHDSLAQFVSHLNPGGPMP